MELFHPQPDLSLQISLPAATTQPPEDQRAMDMVTFWTRSNHTINGSTATPIKGIPVYRPPPPFSFLHHRHQSSRLLLPPRRSTRAPRMKWTSTLHARFVHAVDLLGGHERATPKSVLELMDVKDLTLAHVKSHLQMYRTVKSTDHKPLLSCSSSAVLLDGFENGSNGEISFDNPLEIKNPHCRPESDITPSMNRWFDYANLGCNSLSKGARLHGSMKDNGLEKCSFEKDRDEDKRSNDNNSTKPNLDFTLGI